MTLLLRVTLIAALSGTCCFAQSGTVTFYSLSISAKSEAAVFLPKSQQPFGGWLSDGPQRLAHFQHGRFATFHLNIGPHSFAVLGPTGPGKEPLVLNIKDGGQYCVRLFAKMINVGVYGRWENQIEEVPCQQAEREATHLKPVDSKQIDPAASNELDPGTKFPSGSQSQH
jgi:hypothetical protein